MKDKEFIAWLVKSGQQESSAKSVVSRIRRIEEVYPDLDSRIEDNSIEALLNVFTYTRKDEAKNREPLHKIEINGKPFDGTQSLRSALARYIEFRCSHKKEMPETGNSKTQDTESSIIPILQEIIYKGDEFKVWLPENNVNSVNQYISYLRNLGGYLAIKGKGVSAFEYASRLLAENKQTLAFELLEKLDEELTGRLSSSAISSKMRRNINNWRSGLRKYVDFLQDNSEDIPDEEELEEAATNIPSVEVADADPGDSEKGENLTYSLDELRRNFGFRLSTQNRMSNDKDVFYPISIIRKLFCYCQRNGKATGTPNSDYDWFKNWINDYAEEIKVLTGNNSFPLSEIQALLIYPSTENVYIQLPEESGNFWVYTQTKDGNKEPMKTKSLRQIHIDHTPPMAQVLSDNISKIPALYALSEEIKTIAKAKRIDIKPKNFGKISKLLFADKDYVNSQLLPLIPALKDELNLLKRKCTLTLMQASHNLRKK
ncbi:MAG: hypothetical protein HDS31_05420 [Bacteroides sp.]|nr:hypothetical protein [Bacteroides sp.]